MADPPPPDAHPEQSPATEKPPAAPLTPEPEDAAEQDVESEVDEEYVSDPDDALPEMRRREASDDEGSEEGRRPPRARIDPDHDDDGQGAPEDYEGEVEEDEDEEYYDDLLDEEEVGEGLEEEYDGHAVPPKEVAAGQGEAGEKPGEEGAEAEAEADGEEKKEQEPFAVPTSGAFYMHDDRFQEDGRGRRRRMLGGRKLWDAKDDQAWVHDRFEEMNVHEERYEDKRMSRGRFRGRGSGGRTRGTARGFSRGGRYHSYHEDSDNQNHSENQNRPQKIVRGRGPRRYDTIAKNNRDVVGFQRKQPTRSREPTAHSAAAREPGQISNAHSEAVPAKKNVVNSSLNSASPPFYPSGASNQVGAQRRDIQPGGSNKVHPSSMKMDDNMKLQSGPVVRGKGTTDYGGRDRFHAEGPVRPSPARSVGGSSYSSGFASSSINSGQSPNNRAQGGNASIGVPSHNRPTPSFQQTSRVSTQQQNHNSIMHQKSGQVPSQAAMRIPTQQLSHRTGNASPSAQHLPARSTESDENGSYPSSNQSKTSEVEKTNKETGRGSFMYGGAQVIGAAGLAQGEQNFPGTPALLPVMQFGGQHPGGLGVPTVGMALPGYVAQQQLGMGNNEMAWLPLLAGAAGAFGGSYPPYITLDPSFYSRSSGQTSSSVPSREGNVNHGAKSPPQNDIVTEELDQRQNKHRRYSEMNFSQ
ncbi:protein MLN51 homolog [Aegilops tauschii subsp. strangulata]|nr:protein MLN51 homolog [Aegilops tauschii subsp. strangulata]XP_020196975.1 protein MLN51 homolog [Aegilops tauschii subsp. strangulata]XP_044356966.1 protein MLN51 homolog [Triticum aestivum]XP_044356967.1 protein MLN51 homolog [Triticum aestivum]